MLEYAAFPGPLGIGKNKEWPFAVMSKEDFIARNKNLIGSLWLGVAQRYNVTQEQFAERIASISSRAFKNMGEDEDAVNHSDFISGIRSEELCLAIACESGDDSAWRKFESEYRSSMQAAARTLTKDEPEADDLIQFVLGELYGIRLEGDRRLSKLSHYSGKGSLGGWLRAVVYQCFIDRKRQNARFEQVEEPEDFDRLVSGMPSHLNGVMQSPAVMPDEIEDTHLHRATDQALAQAFKEIEAKDRLLLNYYYFDDLTLKEIGVLMSVHEATISRWLARAQREVKKKTEEILQRTHGMRRAEVAECLQIAARTEMDVRKILT